MRVVGLRVKDVDELVQMVFSGLFQLVVWDVADGGERIVVWARTPQKAVILPVCGASTGRVHG